MIAYTKRLSIRPYRISDYEDWREGYLGRLPKQNEFDLGHVPPEKISKAVFRKVLALYKKARESDRLYVLGVFERKSNKHVGFIDIGITSRFDFQCANLGYVIHNQFWGKGYAKEAAFAALRLAFRTLKLHRIEIGVDPKNKASVAVAKAIGGRYEGKRRSCAYEGGGWKSLDYYAIIPEDIEMKSSRPTVRRTLQENL